MMKNSGIPSIVFTNPCFKISNNENPKKALGFILITTHINPQEKTVLKKKASANDGVRVI
jgi:hypothetical protein